MSELKLKNNNGFTLIEILVALAIAGIVMAGIYSAYYSQQKTYIAQGQITDLQQNLRAAMYFMEREIRMAGCDPTGSAHAGIVSATPTSFNFTEDISDSSGTVGNPDGVIESNENITYALNGTNLTRNGTPIAQNIEVLNFVYLGADGSPLLSPVNVKDIRAVQITLVARTEKGDPGYVNKDTFKNQQGTVLTPNAGGTYPKNDDFRRRLWTAQVKCRDLGL